MAKFPTRHFCPAASIQPMNRHIEAQPFCLLKIKFDGAVAGAILQAKAWFNAVRYCMKSPTIVGLLSAWVIRTFLSVSVALLAVAQPCKADTPVRLVAAAEQPLDFKEVFEVLRTNLPGVDEQELSRAAARGLISQLRPKVTLVADSQVTNTATNITATHSSLFDKSYAYVRPGQITTGSDKKFADAIAKLNTNRLKGIVIDLRFSAGEDYPRQPPSRTDSSARNSH